MPLRPPHSSELNSSVTKSSVMAHFKTDINHHLSYRSDGDLRNEEKNPVAITRENGDILDLNALSFGHQDGGRKAVRALSGSPAAIRYYTARQKWSTAKTESTSRVPRLSKTSFLFTTTNSHLNAAPPRLWHLDMASSSADIMDMDPPTIRMSDLSLSVQQADPPTEPYFDTSIPLLRRQNLVKELAIKKTKAQHALIRLKSQKADKVRQLSTLISDKKLMEEMGQLLEKHRSRPMPSSQEALQVAELDDTLARLGQKISGNVRVRAPVEDNFLTQALRVVLNTSPTHAYDHSELFRAARLLANRSSDRKAELERARRDLQSMQEQSKTDLDVVTKDRDRLRRDKNTAEGELSTARDALRNERSTNKDLRQRFDEERAQLEEKMKAESEKKITELQNTVSGLEERTASLGIERDNIQAELDPLKEAHTRLQEEYNKMKEKKEEFEGIVAKEQNSYTELVRKHEQALSQQQQDSATLLETAVANKDTEHKTVLQDLQNTHQDNLDAWDEERQRLNGELVVERGISAQAQQDKDQAETLARDSATRATAASTLASQVFDGVLRDVVQGSNLDYELVEKLGLHDQHAILRSTQDSRSPSCTEFQFVKVRTNTTLTAGVILYLACVEGASQQLAEDGIHQQLDAVQTSISVSAVDCKFFPFINHWLMSLVSSHSDSLIIARALVLLVETWTADSTCADIGWLRRQSQEVLEHAHGPLTGACYRRLVLLARASNQPNLPLINTEGTSEDALRATKSPVDCFLAGPKDAGASWHMILKSSVEGDDRQIMIYYEPATTPAAKSTLAGKRLLMTRSDDGAPWRLERGAEVQVEFSAQPDFGHYILRSKTADEVHDSTKYGPMEDDAQKTDEFDDHFYQEMIEAGDRYVDSTQAQES